MIFLGLCKTWINYVETFHLSIAIWVHLCLSTLHAWSKLARVAPIICDPNIGTLICRGWKIYFQLPRSVKTSTQKSWNCSKSEPIGNFLSIVTWVHLFLSALHAWSKPLQSSSNNLYPKMMGHSFAICTVCSNKQKPWNCAKTWIDWELFIQCGCLLYVPAASPPE